MESAIKGETKYAMSGNTFMPWVLRFPESLTYKKEDPRFNI
jgi:hypothetical protein